MPAEPGRGTLYAEGWQSWSAVAQRPPTASPQPATAPESVAIDCQYGTAAPPGVHQGAGLLAIDPGDEGPVEIFAAVNVAEQVPVIQARVCDGYLIVSADGVVTRRTDAGGGGLTGALGRWGGRVRRPGRGCRRPGCARFPRSGVPGISTSTRPPRTTSGQICAPWTTSN